MRRDRIERSRYAQIALTYTKPWPLRIWAIVTTLTVLWVQIAYGDAGAHIAMLFLGGTMAVWVGAMITAHVKEQLADARSSLTPHFRTPHLLVAAVLFIITVCGLTLLVGWGASPLRWDYGGYDLWLPGYLALVLIVTAAMAWMAHLQSPASVGLLILMITPVWFASGRAMLNDIVRGRSVELGYIILAVAVAALVALWWRMALLHAEMPEYARTMGPGFRLRVQMTGDPGFRRENAAGTGALEAWVRGADRLDQMANVAAAGFWQRVRHWRIVIGLGRTPIFVALVLGLWSFVMPHLTGGMRDKHSRVVLPIMLSVLLPGVIVAAVWPRRWYTLADESLRPASRRQFVREQGAAMAMELAVNWFTLTAAVVTAALLLEPSMSRLAPLWRALPLIVATQILIFGVIVWVMRYRSGWLVVVPIFLATFTGLAVMVVGGALSELKSIQPMLIAAGICAVVGVTITFDAYRRWLLTEFD
jgi:hypothetical protein